MGEFSERTETQKAYMWELLSAAAHPSSPTWTISSSTYMRQISLPVSAAKAAPCAGFTTRCILDAVDNELLAGQSKTSGRGPAAQTSLPHHQGWSRRFLLALLLLLLRRLFLAALAGLGSVAATGCLTTMPSFMRAAAVGGGNAKLALNLKV